MCRLLGYVRDEPTSVEELLGAEGLEGFTALTAVHGDGWGMAWRDADGSTRTVSSPRSAAEEEQYAELVRRPLGRAGFVHLRWATGGLPVTAENTHPFVDGDYAFAHNGHVSPIADLEALLTPESRARLRGDTDSERYFRFLVQCVEEQGGDLETGLRHALGVLLRDFAHCSLNALMLTPSHMVAIHVNSRATSPQKGLREIFDNEAEVPPRHLTEYFAMDYRREATGLTVISSGLDEPGWTPIQEDMAVMVDLETQALTRLDPVQALRDEVTSSGE